MKQAREQIHQALKKAGGEIPTQSLHSLFHLLGREVQKPPYHFVPATEGPWSFQLEADLKKLQKQGIIEEEQGSIKLRENPPRGPEPQWDRALDLAKQAYQESSDKALLEDLERPSSGLSKPMLYTIGYEGSPLEVYMNELLKNGVNKLCDVRKDPVSRKFGFSKKMLEHACETLGMTYHHFPGLGIPKEDRKKIDSEEARQDLLDRYAKERLPQAQHELQELERMLSEQNRIALTCYEADAGQCHRSRITRTLLEQGRVQEVQDL